MFCPKCRSEYSTGYTCRRCEISLVHELFPTSELEYVEYTEILATHSPGDRAIIKSILDAEGITYYFQGEHVSSYVFHAIPVRLMVKKDQAAEAKEILKDLDLSFTFGGFNSSVEKKDEQDEK